MKVAVGCSYTSGTGIAKEETYPCLLGATNLGKPGTDIEYAIWCAHRAVDNNATKIFFQITSWDRITLSTSDTSNWLNNRPWTGEPTYEHFTVADYAASKLQHVNWLYENHVMSNWRTENLAQRLIEFKAWAGRKNCEIVFFDWLPRNGIAVHPTLEPFLPEQSVLDWLGNGYFVDDYYHVNAQGHKIIAESYFG